MRAVASAVGVSATVPVMDGWYTVPAAAALTP